MDIFSKFSFHFFFPICLLFFFTMNSNTFQYLCQKDMWEKPYFFCSVERKKNKKFMISILTWFATHLAVINPDVDWCRRRRLQLISMIIDQAKIWDQQHNIIRSCVTDIFQKTQFQRHTIELSKVMRRKWLDIQKNLRFKIKYSNKEEKRDYYMILLTKYWQYMYSQNIWILTFCRSYCVLWLTSNQSKNNGVACIGTTMITTFLDRCDQHCNTFTSGTVHWSESKKLFEKYHGIERGVINGTNGE